MKSSINIFSLLLTSSLFAQIAFEGSPQPVDSLNSANGQNYLVMDQRSNRMAFTEERGIVNEALIEKRATWIDEQDWEVLVLNDYLIEKGMTSPVGFIGNELIYSQVLFDKGMYSGSVMMTNNRESFLTVDIPFFKNKAPIQSGCISRDGRYMILSVESNNTYGVEDLYVSRKDANGKWSSLKNLGFMINTDFQEITPFLAADNRTLFFATNGRGGEGSFDLFYTVRQDESWRNWSDPVNLGNQVNTNGAESSFAFQEGSDWAYYISSQDSDGYGDIMRIKMKEEIEEDTTTVDEVITEEPAPQKEAISDAVVLKVVDIATNTSIAAELLTESDTLRNVNGLFTIDSLSGKEVEIKSKGYLPKIVMLDEQLKTGENIISLSSIAKGSVIVLDHVLFYRGTANMVEGSEKELDLVVEVMNDNPNIKILLKGHTDNTGDPVLNVKLSEERVKTVKQYLVNQGINPYHVTGRGYGGNEPIASNATEETRKLNRRVEFEVTEE